MEAPQRKILSLEQMDAWVSSARAAGLRLGFTCGSFDLLHAGHVQYLAAARSLCDRLIVAVNSDESIRGYKSPLRPINPEEQRMYVIAGLEMVDAVTRLDEQRPLSLLLRWKPDLYIKGGDYSAGSLRSGEAVREYGGEVRLIQPEFGTSSSGMMERINLLAAHAAPDKAPPAGDRGLALIDRDGTLIRNIPFLHDPAKVEVLPGVPEGLLKLQAAGLKLVIVSNQQGIGLGYFTVQDFIAVNQRLFRELAPHGVRIARVYFCPHSAADGCDCRKPATGMLRRALRDFQMSPEQAVMIGDDAVDLAAAQAAGIPCITVGTAEIGGTDHHANTFSEAAEWAVRQFPVR